MVNILPKSEKLIDIVELIAPKSSSTPDVASAEMQTAEFILGNDVTLPKKNGGEWTATIVIHAQNHDHIRVKVKVIWSGKWKSRLIDIEKNDYKFEIMKKIYVIQYTTKNDIVENRIKTLGDYYQVENSWFLETSAPSSKDLYEELVKDFTKFRIVIIELNVDDYYGWYDTPLWTWLNSKRTQPLPPPTNQ